MEHNMVKINVIPKQTAEEKILGKTKKNNSFTNLKIVDPDLLFGSKSLFIIQKKGGIRLTLNGFEIAQMIGPENKRKLLSGAQSVEEGDYFIQLKKIG